MSVIHYLINTLCSYNNILFILYTLSNDYIKDAKNFIKKIILNKEIKNPLDLVVNLLKQKNIFGAISTDLFYKLVLRNHGIDNVGKLNIACDKAIKEIMLRGQLQDAKLILNTLEQL